MDTPDLNEPEQVLLFLSGAVRSVRDGLDHGISLADQKMSDLDWDDLLWAHLVRHGARTYLGSLTPSDDWELGRELKNSGIEIVRSPIVFRTLKAQAGEPPHPGHSDARRGFWSQQLSLGLVLNGVEFPAGGANLILDWTVGPKREIRLALSKPKGIWVYHGSPKLEWRRSVIVQEGQPLRFEPAEEDVLVEPRFDLTELEGDGEVG